jgi:peptidoglycan hydrolase CwlO-like protein
MSRITFEDRRAANGAGSPTAAKTEGFLFRIIRRHEMVCSMVKKGLLGAALSAGALYLVFGTSAPSYVRTAFHKVRHNAKASVPVQFEIDKTRDEIASLEPVIHENMEICARNEVDVEYLEKEIGATKSNLASETKTLLSMTESVRKGEFRLAGRVSFTDEEIKADLARRLDHIRNTKRILEEKEKTLKSKQQGLAAARRQLDTMASQKKTLMSRLDAIEARLKAIEATKTGNEFNFDDNGALARCKASVTDLEKRLEVLARKAEYEGRYAEVGIPSGTEPGRDVVKEIDAEFNSPATGSDSKTGDKSL